MLSGKLLHPAIATVTTSIINFPEIFAVLAWFAVYVLDLTANGAKFTKGKHKKAGRIFVRSNASVEGSIFFRSCPIYRAVLKIKTQILRR